MGLIEAFNRVQVPSALLVVASLSSGCAVTPDDAASAGGVVSVAGAGGVPAAAGSGGDSGGVSAASGSGGDAGGSGSAGGGGMGASGGVAGASAAGGAEPAPGDGGSAGSGGRAAGGGAAGEAGSSGAGGVPVLAGDPTRGVAVYAATCGRTMCHGAERVGPNLAAVVPSRDDARLWTTIRSGVRGLGNSPGMPALVQLSDQDVADVIAYLRETYPGAG